MRKPGLCGPPIQASEKALLECRVIESEHEHIDLRRNHDNPPITRNCTKIIKNLFEL